MGVGKCGTVRLGPVFCILTRGMAPRVPLARPQGPALRSRTLLKGAVVSAFAKVPVWLERRASRRPRASRLLMRQAMAVPRKP